MTIKIIKKVLKKKREREFIKEFNKHSKTYIAEEQEFGISISIRGIKSIFSSLYYTLHYHKKFDRFILEDCNIKDVNKDIKFIFENIEEMIVICDRGE